MMDIQRIEGFASRESLPVGVLIELLFGESADNLEQQRRAIIFYPDLVTEEEIKKNLMYENFSEWVVARIHPYPGNRASLSDVLKKPIISQDFYSWLCKNKRKLPLPSQAKLFIKIFKKNRIDRNQPILDRPPPTDQYNPSTFRREARKLDTQAKYQKLQNAYKKLRGKHPEKSDRWCAIQISKMPIGKEFQQETIRKKMKK